MTRRQLGAAALALAIPGMRLPRREAPADSRVALVKGEDRSAALKEALALLRFPDFAGRDICLKASFNSADPYPASTHPEMLTAAVRELRNSGCGRIAMLERSGMGGTSEVWRQLGISDLARRLDIALMPLDELPAAEWRVAELPESHWKRGVEIPRFLTADMPVVQICSAKTHRFGGVFSASLKNTIGMIAKYGHNGAPLVNYMQELHESPDQRLMIAEVNQLYSPALVIMDALEVFVTGGPESGDMASPQILAASTDRVALDAVAVAILRTHGAGDPIRRTEVFEHDQLRRAAELKLGAGSGDQIRLLTPDAESRAAALQLRAVLNGTGEEKKP